MAMTDKLRVVIVDDHPLFRDGVAGVLRDEPDMDVVAQGGSAAEALQLATDLLPDIILLDITMPGGGVQAAQQIAAACPVTKIVMLTASEDEEDVTAALQAGARAYILKGVAARELVHIIRSVWAGEVYVTPALAVSLLSVMTKPAAATPLQTVGAFAELSERERQILERVAAGLSNKEIGAQLYLSEKTIKHYMTNILQKLHVHNRVEAALWTQKEQLTDR
jgi:two-component system nitrate/nitrite response regulator NarL